MPQIPNAQPNYGNLGDLPIPDGQRPVVTTDLSKPYEALASSAGEVEKTGMNLMDQQGNLQKSFAQSNYTTKMIEFAKEDENNPDWKGAPDRWRDNQQKALEENAATITIPGAKNAFLADAKETTNRYYAGFLQNVDERKNNYNIANLTQLGFNTEANILSSDDPKVFKENIQTLSDAIQQSVDTGAIKPQQGVEMRQKAVDSIVQKVGEKFIAEGNPEGYRDWLTGSGQIRPAQPEQMATADAMVGAHRAGGIATQLMNGAPMTATPAIKAWQAGQESGNKQVDENGNPTMSSKGAIGLMQLMPATAQDVAKELGIPFDMEKLKYDKDYNRKLGDRYMDDMVTRYHGNQTLALAAYNAGPGMVDDWVNGTNRTGKNASGLKIGNPLIGEVTNEQFAANIPFKETKDYVAKGNAAVPQIPGIQLDPRDPSAGHSAWIQVAMNNFPPETADNVATAVTGRVNAAVQQNDQKQEEHTQALTQPVLMGKVTDISQFSDPKLAVAVANASPAALKMLKTAMRGEDKDGTTHGAGIYNIYKRTSPDYNGPDKIYKASDLDQFVGPDVPPGQRLTLAGRDYIARKMESDDKVRDTRLGNAVHAMVTNEMKGLGADPQAANQYSAAMLAIDKYIDDERDKRKQGKPAATEAELYNPDSPKYAGNIAKAYVRSPAERAASMASSTVYGQTAEDTQWLRMAKQNPAAVVEAAPQLPQKIAVIQKLRKNLLITKQQARDMLTQAGALDEQKPEVKAPRSNE